MQGTQWWHLNQKDAATYAEYVLRERIAPGLLPEAVEILVAASKGLFVYLDTIRQWLPRTIVSLDILRHAPNNLDSVYSNFLKQLHSRPEGRRRRPSDEEMLTLALQPQWPASVAAAPGANLLASQYLFNLLINCSMHDVHITPRRAHTARDREQFCLQLTEST